MTGYVFANGVLANPEHARRVVDPGGLIVAADGGARHLAAIGLKPHAIVGDMDSISGDEFPEDKSIERIAWPADKDRTDAELAIEFAFSRGCGQVILFAATGKRLGHTLGNIALVAKFPARVVIMDGQTTLIAVAPSQKCRLRGAPGTPVSLVAYGPECRKVHMCR